MTGWTAVPPTPPKDTFYYYRGATTNWRLRHEWTVVMVHQNQYGDWLVNGKPIGSYVGLWCGPISDPPPLPEGA
jgi:hypothetical protein